MNNYYTLIYLNRELNEKLGGGIFEFSISPHKDVLELYIRKEENRFRMIFSSNPNETALFLDSYRPPKKANVTEFFQRIEGEKITGLSLADKDRLIYLHFGDNKFLQFKLFSGSPNVFLVEEDKITDSFKNPDDCIGQAAPKPFAPNFAEEVSSKAKPKNQITSLNPLLPRNLLPYLIKQHRVDEMSVAEVKEFVKEITEALLNDPHPRVLESGDLCLWSQEVLDKANDKTFDTVNHAVLHAYRNAVHLRRLHDKKDGILQMLERVLSKKESQLKQLKQADKSLERADEYEKFGHLLMAQAHRELEHGSRELEVDDYYEDNDTVRIPLKEGLSIAENAQQYYEKAKSSRKSYQEAKKRIPNVKQEVQLAGTLMEEANAIKRLPELDSWIKDRSKELKKFGYGTEDDTQARSPFRKFKKGKYEIWIGKSAKSNDELTSLAHKEDIWLHARGVAGSHVVIRMGNRNDFPPQEVILTAAGYAAYYSKAKGMKTAPVMYTKCKYVRKPKGAGPGAVVVEREEVELVPPLNPQKHQ